MSKFELHEDYPRKYKTIDILCEDAIHEINGSFENLANWLLTKQSSIVEQYPDATDFSIKIDAFADGYGDIEFEVIITYSRQETEQEYTRRVNTALKSKATRAAKKINKNHKELVELERLAKKLGKTVT